MERNSLTQYWVFFRNKWWFW